ncbi:ABC transporter substrate-binding protein [Oceaniovalibus sp. ACAM 378]|uniref:ABC transporter substrate-binding protein n=1 Tax=Oceaniovalibus sp. ACAM 378 TaxID=2599923 RepID=UPI00165222AE|nr:ABC transporter substrate-binding protein [Oceaniovalibus sp. ACAM 378]
MTTHKKRVARGVAYMAAAATINAAPLFAQDMEPQYGGELIYAQSGEKFSLFPGRNTDNGAQDIWLNACENLFEINEDSELVPVLAESWEVSDDEKTVTIKLREGVAFHDGTPFNGEAVAFVFNEAKEKEFIYMSLLEGFDYADAPSENEVAFHLAAPFAALLPNLAYKPLCIFSPTAYQEMGEEGMATKIVGTGPFTHEEYVKGEYNLFVKNENYWQDELPYLDSIRMLVVPDPATRTAMLESGEIDRTVQISDFDLPRLEANPELTVRTMASTRQFYVVLNHMKAPFDNQDVRLALNYAIDKAGIVQSVFAGTGATVPMAPTLSPGVYGYTDMRKDGEDSIFQYDADKARSMLTDAGFEDRNGDGTIEGEDGTELSFKLWTRRGGTKGDYQVAQLLQAFLGEIGIGIDLEVMEGAAFSAAVSQPPEDAKYEMALLSWGIPTADPDEPMMYFTHTKAWKPKGANRMFFSSSEIDRLADLAHTTTDQEKRKEYVVAWMAQLLEEAPVIYLPTIHLTLGSRSYVHGDRILATDNYPAVSAWIDQEEKARQGIKR